MSNKIVLKKGLNIPIAGAAEKRLSKKVIPGIVAVQPTDFKGLIPRLLVKEGDVVLAGSPVMADKNNPDILVASPVSGTVKEVVRGEKRKLLAVLIQADDDQKFVDFGVKKAAELSAEDVKAALLSSGLWVALIQRPYGIVADPQLCPKGIYVSAFSTAPLAADSAFAFDGERNAIQAGIDALSKLAPVNVGICAKCQKNSFFAELKNCTVREFQGKHPIGNVGVQIAAVSPIKKGETVWTVNVALLAAIGKLFTTGRYDVRRKVAVTGPMAIDASYLETVPGMPMTTLKPFYGTNEDIVRVVSGDVLTGANVGINGYLRFQDNQVTLIKEGTEKELLGWARPLRVNQYSFDHTYFNWCLGWLTPGRKYDMDTNLHGGPRAFFMPDSYYGKVIPMDIYPLYLIKACITGNIEKMEKFGIYEVLPEDLALVEYIDPSKNYIQDMIAKGIDLMLKEMA